MFIALSHYRSGAALPQKPKVRPLIHTGLQPGDERQQERGTVLTVCSSGQCTEAVEYEGVTSTAGRRNR
jgi:hypothetical protein